MSPFDGLKMPRDLACEFFAVFSRFEFALKECDFIHNEKDGRAVPDWRSYREKIARDLKVPANSELAVAIKYLNAEPPDIQVGAQKWAKDFPLRGTAPFGTALDACQRVRNNLFHGGKHSPESKPGRDETLVRSALSMLYACLEQDHQLREAFEQPTDY